MEDFNVSPAQQRTQYMSSYARSAPRAAHPLRNAYGVGEVDSYMSHYEDTDGDDFNVSGLGSTNPFGFRGNTSINNTQDNSIYGADKEEDAGAEADLSMMDTGIGGIVGRHPGSIHSLKAELTSNFWSVLRDPRETRFDSAEKLFNIVKDHIQELGKRAPLLAKSKRDEVVRDIARLKQERNTWRLVFTVLRDRLDSSQEMDMMEDFDFSRTDKEVIADLYRTDAQLRQSHLVVEWLEESAGFEFDEFIDAANYESADVCWRSTLDTLVSRRGKGRVDLDARTTVCTLDPDAPLRTGTALAEQDHEDETRLMRKVFALVRIGDVNRAQRLCAQAGQPWRAATMEGWRLWHDHTAKPLIADDDDEGVEVVRGHEGNALRDVWKENCLHLSNDESILLHERAVYAALCGNLGQLLRVCHSWEDALWAHFRVLVDRTVDQRLREVPIEHRGAPVALPEWYNDTAVDPAGVFEELQASVMESIANGANEALHRIQAWVILYCVDVAADGSSQQKHINALMEYLHELVTTPDFDVTLNTTTVGGGDATVAEYLRLFAHLVIFFRDLGLIPRREAPMMRNENDRRNLLIGNDVVRAYVGRLIEEKSETTYEYVAMYTAELDPESQISCYTAFVCDFADTALRKQCLQYAEEAGLDVSQITKSVVETIRRQGTFVDRDDTMVGSVSTTPHRPVPTAAAANQSFQTLGPGAVGLNEADRKRIQSIEWLTFHRTDRPEALMQSNHVMREFLAARNLEGAQAVLLKLPNDSDIVAEAVYADKHGSAMPFASVLAEHRGIRSYVEANDAFDAWFRYATEERPTGGEGGPVDHTGTDVQRFLQSEAEHVAHERRHARWLEQCNRLAEDFDFKTKMALVNAQPWFDIIDIDGDERAEQLRALRGQCVPQLLRNRHRVLHDSGLYSECIQMAVHIADDPFLVEVFTECRDELRALLKLIRESSLRILENQPQNDPFGFPIAQSEPM
eukprot:m.779638 g.779638  ORF g.779638 m.779638 type:complete len:972 (-) comp23279_c0_seq5:3481-6396(-)